MKTLRNPHIDDLSRRWHITVLGRLERRSELGAFYLVAQCRTDTVKGLC